MSSLVPIPQATATEKVRLATSGAQTGGGIPRVALEEVARLSAPVALIAVPGDEAAWVAERAGRVLRVDFDSRTANDVVLDITSEVVLGPRGGLLGIAATSRWLFVHFTGPPDDQADAELISRVVAFRRSGTGLSGQRVELLAQAQPHANNNGGDLAIGPDGNLYVSLGDGGGSADPDGNAQDPRTWMGGLLRITPTPELSQPYLIPADNPFASNCEDGAGEVYVYGTRNPWRLSFDSLTGDLWVADAGGFGREEINLLRTDNGRGNGANLGWPMREGTVTHSAEPLPAGLVDPVWEYPNPSDGCAVIGGQVYRGSQNSRLSGLFVFGDYCTSELWALRQTRQGVEFVDLGVSLPAGELVSIGTDADGELYALSLSGPVYRVVHLSGQHRFTSPAAFELREGSTLVGQVTATDDTAATTRTYRISGGEDRAVFKIDVSGRLVFAQSPDFERPHDSDADNVYEVDVTAGSDPPMPEIEATQSITVTVIDEGAEAPATPTAAVSSRTSTTATLHWTEPDNSGPPITGYDIRFRDIGGSWRNLAHLDTSRTATATHLDADRIYEFQVRAYNDESTGRWSNPPARTDASQLNRPPRFTSSTSVNVNEHSRRVLTVSAVDDDPLDEIVGFAIDPSSADGWHFELTDDGRVLSFKLSPDHERPHDADQDNTYELIIEVTSGQLSRRLGATQAITVTVDDVVEVPARPDRLSVSVATTELSVDWRQPLDTGPQVNSYVIEYKESSESFWRTWSHSSALRTATITMLEESTSYDLRISARNDEGTSQPSWIVTATTSPLTSKLVMGGFTQPVDLRFVDGDAMAWVAERDGYVTRVDLSDATVVETVLDISDETRRLYDTGLLGIEVDSDWLYIHYTDLNNDNRIDAIRRSGTGVDTSQRHTILTQTAGSTQHFGGQVVFGPDGYLYVGLGDRLQSSNGQDTSTIAGSIIRIEPTPGESQPYNIPADNPFVPDEGEESTEAPEIYVYGIKNPWRFSFDSQNNDLWVVDNGSGAGNEEVNHLPAADGGGSGANLGWGAYEGTTPRTGAAEPANHTRPTYQFTTQRPHCFYRGTCLPRTARFPSSRVCTSSVTTRRDAFSGSRKILRTRYRFATTATQSRRSQVPMNRLQEFWDLPRSPRTLTVRCTSSTSLAASTNSSVPRLRDCGAG